MRRKLPTLLILMVMVLVGAAFWVDLSYYTDPSTDLITRGEVWWRHLVLILPVGMALLGLRTVGPRAISVMRVKNKPLGWLFAAAALVSVSWGGTHIVFSLNPPDAFQILLGIFTIWYGVWMFLTSIQLMGQSSPSPTKSAVSGVMAAVPFAMITIYRILVSPSSLYRVGPLVRAFAGLFAMLWFGLLLRALYIALPRRRVKWTYFMGVLTFLFTTCLELPLIVHALLFSDAGLLDLFESLNMAIFGLVAAGVSVAIADKSDSRPE